MDRTSNQARRAAARLMSGARGRGLRGVAVLEDALLELEYDEAVWGGLDYRVAQLLLDRLRRAG